MDDKIENHWSRVLERAFGEVTLKSLCVLGGGSFVLYLFLWYLVFIFHHICKTIVILVIWSLIYYRLLRHIIGWYLLLFVNPFYHLAMSLFLCLALYTVRKC